MSLHVRAFRSSDAADFARLNLRWIEEYFGVEDSDRAQLGDPEAAIVAPGGTIAMAEVDGEVVGCGALVPPHITPEDGRTWLEVVKMATDPAAQGKGAAGAVMDFLIAAAREQGCDALWLETNDTLSAALHLYERKGFKRLGEDELWPTPYARCNCQMVLTL